MARRRTPELAPVLSRGKHRNPRKGACFMEYASLLAGEKWSDHPDCTHPLLASVARQVNDHTSDDARATLVTFIPSVIGLNGDDPRLDVRIAIRCAALAIPVVAESRQRALAVSLLAARQVLDELGGARSLEDDRLENHAAGALASVPHATSWAEEFMTGHQVTAKAFRKRSAPAAVRVAIIGIAEAAIPDADDRLHELLSTVIDDCCRWLGVEKTTMPSLPGSTVRAESRIGSI
ncbi:MAG: hypothetical protein ACLFRT_02935 [Actinomycetota bacterium]